MLLLSGMLFAGCGPTPPADEGMPAPRPLPIDTFEIHWNEQLETSHGKITRIFTRDAYLIGYTDDGTCYVLDRATGHMSFKPLTIRHGDETLHAPVVLKDFIVFPTTTSLEVYNREGALVRSKDLRYAVRSEAAGNKTFVYFGADIEGGGRVVAVGTDVSAFGHFLRAGRVGRHRLCSRRKWRRCRCRVRFAGAALAAA
jgi:hypothetical protein